MSLFDQLISGVCLLHPVFLSDVLSDVIDVMSKYSAAAKAILPRLTTCVFLRQKIWDVFYDPPGMRLNISSNICRRWVGTSF